MKTCFYIILVFFLLILPGCKDADKEDQDAKTSVDKDVPTGTIYFTVPSKNTNISIGEAESEANFYEFIVYNNSEFISGTSDSVNGTLTVPVGTYKILALAGSDYLHTSLLGSGTVNDVVVVQDQRTYVTIYLKNIESTFTAPSQVICGRTFTVDLTGDTGNPLILFSSHNLTTDGLSSAVDGSTGLSVTTPSQIFDTSSDRNAPVSPGTEEIRLRSTGDLWFVDPEFGIDKRMYTLHGFSKDWAWLSDFAFKGISSSSVLYDDIVKTVSYIADPTGLGISVQWGEP